MTPKYMEMYGGISSGEVSFSSVWMFWLTFGWGHFITKILRNILFSVQSPVDVRKNRY